MDLRDYMRLVRKRWRIISRACSSHWWGRRPHGVVTEELLGAGAGLRLRPGDGRRPHLGTPGQQLHPAAREVVRRHRRHTAGHGPGGQVRSASTSPASSCARKISASNPLDTFLLNISVTDNDPELAAKMANAVAIQFPGEPSRPSESPGPGLLRRPWSRRPSSSRPTYPPSRSLRDPRSTSRSACSSGSPSASALAVLRESLDTSDQGRRGPAERHEHARCSASSRRTTRRRRIR